MEGRNLTLETRNVDWVEAREAPKTPALRIQFGESDSGILERFEDSVTGHAYPDDIEVTFRLRGSSEESDTRGVLAISHSLTGEYLLELETSEDRIADFVNAVHWYAEEKDVQVRYEVWLCTEEGLIWDYEKHGLLVRGDDGDLLRSRSLIPTWLEV
jgi:hypothetical protein